MVENWHLPLQGEAERKDLGEIVKPGLIFSSPAARAPAATQTTPTKKGCQPPKGDSPHDGIRTGGTTATPEPGTLVPRSPNRTISSRTVAGQGCHRIQHPPERVRRVLQVTVGTAGDLPRAAGASGGWRGHGAGEERLGTQLAGEESPGQGHGQVRGPAQRWPKANQGTVLTPRHGEDTASSGDKHTGLGDKRGPAAPHAARFHRVAAGPFSQRETPQGWTGHVALNWRGWTTLLKVTFKAPREQQAAKGDAAARKAPRR